MISFVVLGEPASKANSRRIVLFGKRPALIKSAKAIAYAKSFQRQCPKPTRMLLGDLVATIRIFYASRRPDLDASVILDAMQGLVYQNDRQVKEMHLHWGLDPKRPRAEISVQAMQPVLIDDA